MQKTMDNAVLAAKPGGVVIILAECEEGVGSPVLAETVRRLQKATAAETIDAIEADLRANFKIGAHKAFAITRLFRKARFILVTSLDQALCKELLFTDATTSAQAALDEAVKLVNKPDYKVMLMPTGSLTVPLYKG